MHLPKLLVRHPVVVAAVALGAALAAGCAPASSGTGSTSATVTAGSTASATPSCTKASLKTLTPGTLTVGTDKPAYEPWFKSDDPGNGQGYESAVAYAVADKLGYAKPEVKWTVVGFNAAIAPGPKTFDVDINQVSISPERKKAVDFSTGYYDVAQAVVTVKGSKAAAAKTIAELKPLKLGAQVGTTSYKAIKEVIAPTKEPAVFNTNDDAKLALANGQIDAMVVDLPTALYITAAELDGKGVLVGQLPSTGGGNEQFGMVLDKGSSLTACVGQAVDALRADGTLAKLQQQWLTDTAGAPVLK